MSSLIETPSFLKRVFLNPIAVRELRVACRGWKLVIILTCYLLVQGAIFTIWAGTQYDTLSATYNNPTSIGSGLFITMSIVLVCVVMLVFPAFSSTAIAAEHERKSFDLLMLTPLTPWEIALGKFIAAGVQASVFLVATIPLFALVSLFGGIDPAVFFMTLWILILLSLLISFIGVYASSLVTKAIPAVLVTYMFAILLGVILIIIFSALMVAASIPGIRAAYPIVSLFVDPTVSEGVFYAVAFGVTTAIYCSYFFLSTTNRLKPMAHNKSTSLRMYWTAAMIVMPTLFASYFTFTRQPNHDTAVGTLIITVIYIGLALLVPALTFPAEPAIASRRVRREIEKMPQPLLQAGGAMFLPGSARGTSHTAFLAVLGFGLMLLVGSVCYGRLSSALDDKSVAAKQASELVNAATHHFSAPSPGSPSGSGGAPTARGVPSASMALGASSERELVERYSSHEHMGILYLMAAMALSVLVISQITWRISLSGLSKSLAGVLAGLVIASWIVVPLIVEGILSRGINDETKTIAQFSPVRAGMNGWQWGKSEGLKTLTISASPDYLRHEQRALGFEYRWLTFMGTTGAIGLCLLASNLWSHRKIMRMVALATAQGQADEMPVAYSRQAVSAVHQGQPTYSTQPQGWAAPATVAPSAAPVAPPAAAAPADLPAPPPAA